MDSCTESPLSLLLRDLAAAETLDPASGLPDGTSEDDLCNFQYQYLSDCFWDHIVASHV